MKNKLNEIYALILAGGDSTRLWPLEDKIFFQIFGDSLLSYKIKQLSNLGIDKFLIVHNRLNETKVDIVKDQYKTLEIRKILQSDPRSMSGAIISAKKQISGKSILIAGGEETYGFDLLTSFKDFDFSSSDIVIAAFRTKKHLPYGYLKIEAGHVKQIIEKPREAQRPSDLVNIVFHYHKNADLLLQELEKNKDNIDDIYEKAINNLIEKKHDVKYFVHDGYWSSLKYPWQILDISKYYLENFLPHNDQKFSPVGNVKFSGDVFIGENVRILGDADIIGPTYIGDNTIIGQNALIRETIIEGNCVVGYGTEIARSYIGKNCWFHKNYIGDSVLDENCAFGAGAVTANFRLDEKEIYSKIQNKRINTYRTKLGCIIGKNCRIGINASIMPGVKVGSNSFIGSGVILDQDLKDDSFVQSKGNYRIISNKRKVERRKK